MTAALLQQGTKYVATTDPAQRQVITDNGLDPDRFVIKKSKAWDTKSGTNRSYEFGLDPTVAVIDDQFIDDLGDVAEARRAETFEQGVASAVKIIRQYKPSKNKGLVGHDAMVFNAADWQIGKAEESGFGTDETVRRIMDCLYQAERYVKAQRAMGNVMPTLVIQSTGDLVEGCDGFYSNQLFMVDRDRRSQINIVVDLLTKIITVLGRHFDYIEVIAVAGNHGEHRGGGKVKTTMHDNDDVLVWDMVKHSFDLMGQGNITWTIAQHELVVVREVAGVKLGITHGHLFKSGAAGAIKWFRDQVFGKESVSDIDILTTGHYHSFVAYIVTLGRTWFQCPTPDPGSDWFRESSGISSAPGVLVFRLDHTKPDKWDDLKVLIPSRPVDTDVAA